MINEFEEFEELLNELRNELKNERSENLNLIDVIHQYESILVNLNTQLLDGSIKPSNLDRAYEFSKKVTGKTFDEIYSKQNSISNIDHILEIFTNDINKKDKLH
jgi:hypothetical protein